MRWEDDNCWGSSMSSGCSSEGLNEDSRLPSVTHSSFYLSRCSFPAWLLLHLPLPIFKAPKEVQGPSPWNPLRGGSNLYTITSLPHKGSDALDMEPNPGNCILNSLLCVRTQPQSSFPCRCSITPDFPPGWRRPAGSQHILGPSRWLGRCPQAGALP